MNKNVGLVYDHFLKFTNEFAEPYKRQFLSISDVVDVFTALKLVSMTVTTKTTTEYDLSVERSQLVITNARRVLEHTMTQKNIAIDLKVLVNDTEFVISYADEKYVTYPKEVAKIVKKMDVGAYFYLTFTEKKLTEDDIHWAILNVFFPNAKCKMSTSPAIARYFDIATGYESKLTDSTKEAKDITNKQIAYEQLQAEIETKRNVIDKLNIEIEEIKNKANAIKRVSSNLESNKDKLSVLKEDARVLTKGIEEITAKLDAATKLLPKINDELLTNTNLEQSDRVKLADAQRKTQENKKTYERILADNRQALKNIMSQITILESENAILSNTSAKEEDPSKILTEKEKELRAHLLEIQDLSNTSDTLKRDIMMFNDKGDSLKYTKQINFADTVDFLKENCFLSKENNIVYNFLIFYVDSFVSRGVDAHQAFKQIFGF